MQRVVGGGRCGASGRAGGRCGVSGRERKRAGRRAGRAGLTARPRGRALTKLCRGFQSKQGGSVPPRGSSSSGLQHAALPTATQPVPPRTAAAHPGRGSRGRPSRPTAAQPWAAPGRRGASPWGSGCSPAAARARARRRTSRTRRAAAARARRSGHWPTPWPAGMASVRGSRLSAQQRVGADCTCSFQQARRMRRQLPQHGSRAQHSAAQRAAPGPLWPHRTPQLQPNAAWQSVLLQLDHQSCPHSPAPWAWPSWAAAPGPAWRSGSGPPRPRPCCGAGRSAAGGRCE